MAKPLRRPPGTKELVDPRSIEYWRQAIFDQLSLVATRTVDVANIAAGATGSFTVTVSGVRADEGMQVIVGLPSAINTGLMVWGNVTADNEVTVYLYNRTGGGIDPPSATYAVRVMR